MPEYGISWICGIIWAYTGQRKPVFWHILGSNILHTKKRLKTVARCT